MRICTDPHLEFTHARGTWRLVKHPRDRRRPDIAAAPWYLRLRNPETTRPTWIKIGNSSDPRDELIANARQHLDAARAGASPFAQYRSRVAYRQTMTLAALAEQWRASGYAHPDNSPRTDHQQSAQKYWLDYGLRWWGGKPVAQIRPMMLSDYAAHCRGSVTKGTGERTADLVHTTLSNLFSWAVARELADRNPFAGRTRYRKSADVRHASQKMLASDEELHQVLSVLFAEPANASTAALLTWCALTGQRPGEPCALRWDAGSKQPGERYTTPAGTDKMAVYREKHGRNPAVVISPTCADFLSTWRRWTAANYPASPWMFPNPHDCTRPLIQPGGETKHLNRHLQAASVACGFRVDVTAHSMRAYYVRVRWSQGADDTTIAAELGHGSGPDLIARVYGNPGDSRGDQRYDWIPEPPIRPAWHALTAPANNTETL